jgi:hypothetical protein
LDGKIEIVEKVSGKSRSKASISLIKLKGLGEMVWGRGQGYVPPRPLSQGIFATISIGKKPIFLKKGDPAGRPYDKSL